MVFGEKPSSLYTLAHDAVVIADGLSKSDSENINEFYEELVQKIKEDLEKQLDEEKNNAEDRNLKHCIVFFGGLRK